MLSKINSSRNGQQMSVSFKLPTNFRPSFNFKPFMEHLLHERRFAFLVSFHLQDSPERQHSAQFHFLKEDS